MVTAVCEARWGKGRGTRNAGRANMAELGAAVSGDKIQNRLKLESLRQLLFWGRDRGQGPSNFLKSLGFGSVRRGFNVNFFQQPQAVAAPDRSAQLDEVDLEIFQNI